MATLTKNQNKKMKRGTIIHDYCQRFLTSDKSFKIDQKLNHLFSQLVTGMIKITEIYCVEGTV